MCVDCVGHQRSMTAFLESLSLVLKFSDGELEPQMTVKGNQAALIFSIHFSSKVDKTANSMQFGTTSSLSLHISGRLWWGVQGSI